ncbi:MAG: N-acetylmuramoyl-L-alanine amidase [Lachnospiraceae bacterium]|nr:N-acetylmuramoyl-L-alanine amidase [Lachnospiraceae bacterium]
MRSNFYRIKWFISKLPGIFLAAFLLYKELLRNICVATSLIIFLLIPALNVYAERPVVVVLDPGHGGDNTGAIHNGFIEKDMNLIVALAMKEELEKYEGIVVYLTHDDAMTNMSLKERAEFAASQNADFMYCLHFNMSESHMLYGAEVWVSAFDVFYAKGHAFGQIIMQAFSEMGLFNRGIKTRINNRDDDYYGIIRESRALGVDTILIEHCHLDHIIDKEFYALGDFQLEEFGRVNATAVAKYFKLASSILGVDYSDYPVPVVEVPTEIVRPDLTPPDISHLELISLNIEERVAEFNLMAEDYDSLILYYGISLDGGISFDILQPFPAGTTELTISVNLPPEKDLKVVAAVYNAYDRITQSNIIEISALPIDEIIEDIWEEIEEIIDISLTELTRELTERQDQINRRLEVYQYVIIGIAVLMVLVVIIIISRVVLLIRVRSARFDK